MTKNPTDLPLHRELGLLLTTVGRVTAKVTWVIVKPIGIFLAYWLGGAAATIAIAMLLMLVLPIDASMLIAEVIVIAVALLWIGVRSQRAARAGRAETAEIMARIEAAHVAAVRTIYGDDIAGFDQWKAERDTRRQNVAASAS